MKNTKEYAELLDPNAGKSIPDMRWERAMKKQSLIQKLDNFLSHPLVELILVIAFFIIAYCGAVMFS